ncbi:MAG: glycosyltransferase family 2 protein [Candidatus Omnitrophota bacterium]
MNVSKEQKNLPLVSIIIPSYNEEDDIKTTLRYLTNLTYKNKEIIVIDDSNDRTPEIIKEFFSETVRLVHREKNIGGRCGARNEGILLAKGEIVVIINADCLLPEDYIEKILKHYNEGADYLIVKNTISNPENFLARYVEAVYHFSYDGQDWIEWSEGFSCRKKILLAAGMFPVTPVPLISGEDGYFGEQLKNKGFKKVIDRSIQAFHISPHTLKGYWRARKEKRSALPLYFLYKKPFVYLFLKEILVTVYFILYIILIFPMLIFSLRLQKHSPRPYRDTIPFLYAIFIEKLANICGGWKSILVLFSYIFKNLWKKAELK